MKIYSIDSLYVGLSVRLQKKKSKNMVTRFSRPVIEIDDCFFLCTFFSYKSIFTINILYIGLSVRLQKAEMYKYRNMIFLANKKDNIHKSKAKQTVDQTNKQ